MHDPNGVDRAAAVFAAAWMLATTDVDDDSAIELTGGLWNLVTIDGRSAGCDVDLSTHVALPDGIYAASQGERRHLVGVINGRVAVVR